MLNTIIDLTQDKNIFWTIQILLSGIVLFGLVNERLNKNSGRLLKRGKFANKILYVCYGIISIILFEVIQNSSVGGNHKVFITIYDLFLLLYVCFFNSWSRNKIIGIYGKFETKIENL